MGRRIKVGIADKKRADRNAYLRKWASLHKDYVKNRHKKYYDDVVKHSRLRLKMEVLSYYGNGPLACVLCGYRDIRALSIDHIQGGGSAHTRMLNKLGKSLYSWLKQENYPSGFQTLCMNCQTIKKLGLFGKQGGKSKWSHKMIIRQGEWKQ